MPSLQIRDMPEEVYEALAFRARLEHRSPAQRGASSSASRTGRPRPGRSSPVTSLTVLDASAAIHLVMTADHADCPIEKGS